MNKDNNIFSDQSKSTFIKNFLNFVILIIFVQSLSAIMRKRRKYSRILILKIIQKNIYIFYQKEEKYNNSISNSSSSEYNFIFNSALPPLYFTKIFPILFWFSYSIELKFLTILE